MICAVSFLYFTLRIVKKWPNLASFCLFSFIIIQLLQKKTVAFSRIRTLIIGVEGKYADHLTTTTAPRKDCLD